MAQCPKPANFRVHLWSGKKMAVCTDHAVTYTFGLKLDATSSEFTMPVVVEPMAGGACEVSD
jgi:hypothetical protein